MARKRNGGIRLLKIAGGIVLIIGGIAGISKYVIAANYSATILFVIAFVIGIWILGQVWE